MITFSYCASPQGRGKDATSPYLVDVEMSRAMKNYPLSNSLKFSSKRANGIPAAFPFCWHASTNTTPASGAIEMIGGYTS